MPVADPDYKRRHNRLRYVRGPASAHLCAWHVETGVSKPARHWATVHGESGEDPWADYLPLCVSCHTRYDITPEARARRSAAARGRTLTQETKDKIAAAQRRSWAATPREWLAPKIDR